MWALVGIRVVAPELLKGILLCAVVSSWAGSLGCAGSATTRSPTAFAKPNAEPMPSSPTENPSAKANQRPTKLVNRSSARAGPTTSILERPATAERETALAEALAGTTVLHIGDSFAGALGLD